MTKKEKAKIELVSRVVAEAMEYQRLYADRNPPNAPEELEASKKRLKEFTNELLMEFLGRAVHLSEVDQALRLEEP